LALGSACLTLSSFLVLDVPPKISILFISFFLTLSMYNLNRLTDIKEDFINYPERMKFIVKYKKILIFLVLCLLGTAILIAYFESILPIVLMILALSFMYSIKWVPKKISKYQRFKDILIVKNIIISITWSLTTVFTVAFNLGIFNTAVLVFFMFIFSRLFINTIIFDIRDIEGDKIYNIKTIPNTIGIRKTKFLLYSLNSFFALFLFFCIFVRLISNLAYFFFFSIFYTYLYIYFCNKERGSKFYDFVVDGEFIIIGILAIIGHSLI